MKKNGLSRRKFLKSSAYGAGALSMSPGVPMRTGSAQAEGKPNILFLFTDQQSIKAMSAYGNRYLHTPFMDSLAANGVRFENSYCTSPVCGPSRSSFITGNMPHQTGVVYNGDSIVPSMPTMGRIFRDAGYHTAWVGKWHLPASYPEVKWGRGGAQYIENATIPDFEYLPTPRGTKFRLGSQTDTHVTDRAVEFLRRKHDKPFVLAVSLHNPHDACWIVRDKLGKSLDHVNLPPLPVNYAIDPDEPEFIRECRKREKYGPEMLFTKGWDENRWRVYLQRYLSLAEEVDREIGQILTVLREQGLEENTLIVFTSDHGEGMAAHQWVVKLMFWEEVISVPLIVSWKGITPAGAADKNHLVSGMDILPTMCDYAGLTSAPEMTGMNLRPLIDNPSKPGRDYLVSQLHPDPNRRDMAGRMVRTQKYKYISFSTGKNPEMLFDLENDPDETKNLAYDPAMREEIKNHRGMLDHWVKRTGDDFNTPGR